MARKKRYEAAYAGYVYEKPLTHWTPTDEVRRRLTRVDFTKPDGVKAGGMPIITDGKSAYVDAGDGHTAVIACSGMKKSVCCFMPLIVSLAKAAETVENMILTDPKGELYSRTAAVGGLFASLGLDIFVNVPLFSGIPLSALPALAYICAVNSAAGYVCHMMALEKTSAQEASLIFFLKPMIAPLFAFLFLREEITANILLGIVCFLAGSGIAILPGLIAQKKQRA